MFDRLIVSEPEGADFKNRRNYFMVSSLVVGALFLTAVVISIFASDFGLGSSSFELAEMLAPVEMAAVEPEPQRPQRQQVQAQSQVPTRQANIARIDEVPPAVPINTSVVPNTHPSRPKGYFQIAPYDSNPVGGPSGGRDPSATGPTIGSGLSQSEPVADTKPDQPPPPVIKIDPKPRPTVSKGVLNGEAKSLPKPLYSAAAKAVRANGQVAVQVTIDEHGNVISAHAMNGHVLLRSEAERAARNARFSPTYLSHVPVKVTGVITYNFVL
jgi:protein TonB